MIICISHKQRIMVSIVLAAIAAVFLFGVMYQSSAIHAEEKSEAVSKKQDVKTNVPDREVEYEDSLSPEWKKNWDLARELYRDKKYREALVQYEILLLQKENCDEARWEYVTLLIMQGRWNAAGEHLEKLLANDPDNPDYGFAMAEVNVHAGKLTEAENNYRALLAITDDKQKQIRALRGLTKVLEQEGNTAALTDSLEKLVTMQPEAIDAKIQLSGILSDTGDLEKARDILADLEQKYPDNTEVLRLMSMLYNKLGNREREADYRQKLISIDPGDTESHAILQKYYFEKENWAMSLKHLEILLAEKPNDVDLLEKAAALNRKLDRIDRTLEYYDAILSIQPNNKAIQEKKMEAQEILAQDLVVLVEHNGSQKLWQDLVQVTADRLGVYREIANILREKGNTEELMEVLTLICLEDPSDEKVLGELTSLMKETGQNEALRVLQVELKKKQKNE